MRAQVAAKFAKFQRPGQSGAPGSASQPPPQQPGSGAASSQSLNTSNIARQIAEGRRRVEEAAKAKQATSASSNPYLVSWHFFYFTTQLQQRLERQLMSESAHRVGVKRALKALQPLAPRCWQSKAEMANLALAFIPC